MVVTLTTQIGTRANWVGSHYWSALDRVDVAWDDYDARPLFNQSTQGVYSPRLFFIDSPAALGGHYDVIPEEAPTSPPRVKYDQSSLEPKHPFRDSLWSGSNGPLEAYPPFQYWTDFWEPRHLPEFSHILPRNQTSTESQFKFWFEYAPVTPEIVDEMSLRKLVEETEGAVHQVRVLMDPSTSLAEHSLGVSEYLGSCYSKSSCLAMVGMRLESNAAADLVNLAHLIHTELNASDTRSYLMTVFSNLDSPRIENSAIQAAWMECVHPSSSAGGRFTLESASLAIDGKQCFSHHQGLGVGSLGPLSKHGFRPNYASHLPTEFATIEAGTVGTQSLVPLLQEMQTAVKRFAKIDFRPTDRVEREYFDELGETVLGLVNSIGSPDN